jgi:drug/metabolite transporter (DMT)-like permease
MRNPRASTPALGLVLSCRSPWEIREQSNRAHHTGPTRSIGCSTVGYFRQGQRAGLAGLDRVACCHRDVWQHLFGDQAGRLERNPERLDLLAVRTCSVGARAVAVAFEFAVVAGRVRERPLVDGFVRHANDGLQASAASQGAFINSLYVVLVPLLLSFSGRRIQTVQWWAACTAILGIGLLSRGGGQFTTGDLWFFASAIFAAVLVIRRGVHSTHFSSWPLTAVTVWCGLGLASLWLILAQQPIHLEGVPWTPVLYLGVLVTGLSTWLLTFGQSRVSSVNASVIFALEPVWAAGLAAVLIGERLAALGWFGGLLVVAANVLPQWLAQSRLAFQIRSSS